MGSGTSMATGAKEHAASRGWPSRGTEAQNEAAAAPRRNPTQAQLATAADTDADLRSIGGRLANELRLEPVRHRLPNLRIKQIKPREVGQQQLGDENAAATKITRSTACNQISCSKQPQGSPEGNAKHTAGEECDS